jgi:hypothetical protein
MQGKLKVELESLRGNKEGQSSRLNIKLALQKQNRCFYEKKIDAGNKNCLNEISKSKKSKSKMNGVSNVNNLTGQSDAHEIDKNQNIFSEIGNQLNREISFYLKWTENIQKKLQPFQDFVFQTIKSKINETFTREIEVA